MKLGLWTLCEEGYRFFATISRVCFRTGNLRMLHIQINSQLLTSYKNVHDLGLAEKVKLAGGIV